MTAREDQPKPVVRDAAHVGIVSGERLELGEPRECDVLLAKRPLSSDPVDGTVAGRRRDPCARRRRDAPRGPRPERFGERLLNGVLGEIEVTEDPDQGRDGPILLLAEQALDDPERVRRDDG
jgi:hypothetical protein